MWFCPDLGKLDQLYILCRVHRSVPNWSTCAFWTWRRHGVVTRMSFEGGTPGVQSRGPFIRSHSVSVTIPFDSLMDRISRQLQSEGVWFGNKQTSLLFADEDLKCALRWFADRCKGP